MGIETPHLYSKKGRRIDYDGLFVYCLVCMDADGPAYFKFGYSGSIGQRISQIRSVCPVPAKYVCVALVGDNREHTLQVERALHKRFKEYRVDPRREWFRFDIKNPEHKRIFNEETKSILVEMDCKDQAWTKISMAALDEQSIEAQRVFLNSQKFKKECKAASKKKSFMLRHGINGSDVRF